MAQLPDDSSSWIGAAVGAVGTVLTAIAGAYAVVRKSKNETQQTATNAAQTTVQSSLEAVRSVVTSLRDELERKQEEIDELRKDIREVRTSNRLLEEQNTQQGLQLERLTRIARALRSRVQQLEKAAIEANRPVPDENLDVDLDAAAAD